jgi:nucleoside-diphosphate-sugar epimerase
MTEKTVVEAPRRVLVTGAGGFLGGVLARRLAASGHEVVTLQRGEYPDLVAAGMTCHRGSINDSVALRKAMDGCDTVFHVAAKAGVWGSWLDYFRTNVQGTQAVIDACRGAGVKQLVFTSSPSVVFDGLDHAGVDETYPYPRKHLAHYPATKADAERRVLAANSESLRTIALRPHLIWGPGDPHLVPRVLERGRQGKLRRLGSKECLVDAVYVDNAAQAHLLAVEALSRGVGAGEAYFVTNQEPWELWKLLNRILACGGIAPVAKSIPVPVAKGLGSLLETVYRLLGRTSEPPMTRFVASQLSTSHWYSPEKIQRDLGYFPSVSMEEGLARLAGSLRRTV